MLMDFNVIVGLGTFLFGVIYTVAAYNIDRATIGSPMEPLIFPLMLGVGVTICGISLIASAMSELKRDPTKFKKFKFERTAEGKIPRDRILIALTCVAALVYAVIFEKLGYIISTTMFLLFMLMLFRGKTTWKSSIFISVLFSLSVYLLFTKMLTIPLPMMPGGIF
ncbi:MAG TPA: tripartite tricarboxylate transporter TctB family protein [Clostridia bacterium]|nr:tripartite tricarboxylate transporter TctB family protein [Clostridia bacterium]